MADRFPLIVNQSSRRIEELASGDNLNLSDNGIIANNSLGEPGQFLQYDGTKILWAFPENTVTKIKAGNAGTFFSGNITFLEGPSGNITIEQNGGTFTIDSINNVTRFRGTEFGTYVDGDITITGTGNTTITQSGRTIIVDSDFTQVKSDWNAINSVAEILNKPFVPKVPVIDVVPASGSGNLTYDSFTGVFTFTPADLSELAANENQTNWDTAYSWGDHSLVGYLTSYTETDPIFTASPANNITVDNINNWNSAFGWGDHAAVGYLTSYTETDPIFTASAAFTISALQIEDWNTAYNWGDHAAVGYLTEYIETDPIFTASPAFNITISDINNWNSAFGWGDHAAVGYLTSYTETDPIFTASPANNITVDNINNWNSAFGWGDHAAVGYLTSAALPQRESVQVSTSSIANDAAAEVQVLAGKSYLLQKIQTSAAAWVTVYSDITSRNDDTLRNEFTDPLPGTGVIAEVITTGAVTQKLTPAVIGWNDDVTPTKNIYLKVVNKSGFTQPITVTITYVKLEE
jgi:hypothetical protein